MPHPVISVDRAVGHYVEELDIDFEATQQYYENLPHPNKRPLDKCCIHFSALAPHDGPVMGQGVLLTNPNDSKKIDPQAPPADIMIFIGTSLPDKFEDLDTTIKHELAHYAQNNVPEDRKFSEEERALQVQLAWRRGKIAKVLWLAKAAMYSGVYEGIGLIAGDTSDIKGTAGFGLGLAAVSSFLHRKRKRRTVQRLHEELHALYESRETEQEAALLSSDDVSILTVTPRETQLPALRRDKRQTASNRVIDLAHKKLSLTPVSVNSRRGA